MLSSRYLSYLLRHHPEDQGLTLDEFGWCNVQELLKALDISEKDLEECVSSNTRFIFNDDKTFIKAAHGHSVPIKYTDEQVPPDILYHGTAVRFLNQIRQEGLLKMTREAVHLSEDRAEAFKVGSRHASGNPEKTAVLEVRAKQMYNAGFKFYKSEDGVWLVDHVPPQYLN